MLLPRIPLVCCFFNSFITRVNFSLIPSSFSFTYSVSILTLAISWLRVSRRFCMTGFAFLIFHMCKNLVQLFLVIWRGERDVFSSTLPLTNSRINKRPKTRRPLLCLPPVMSSHLVSLPGKSHCWPGVSDAGARFCPRTSVLPCRLSLDQRSVLLCQQGLLQ